MVGLDWAADRIYSESGKFVIVESKTEKEIINFHDDV